MKRLIATKRSSPTLTHSESKKSIVTGWLRILIGLLIYSFGVYLTIYANIGLAPWDCLGMGIAKRTPLNYGSSMVLIGICAIIVQLILCERIGFATLFDALLTGNIVQLLTDIYPYPEKHSLLLGIAYMLFGFLFIALGMYVYMKAEQGCGPKDGLLIAIGKRLPKILLGGSVGIGTVISILGAGAVMHLFYSIIRFEPRKLKHRSIQETFSILFET